MKEVRFVEPGNGAELVVKFDDEGRWQVGMGKNGEDVGEWVVIDPETAPAPISTAVSDLFHAIRGNPTHS